MVKRRNLNQAPAQSLAEILGAVQAQARQGATVPHGIKDLGARGDLVWDGLEGRRSVRDVDADLSAAEVRIAEARDVLAESAARIDAARQVADDAAAGLEALETVTLPGAVDRLEAADREASASLAAALDRIGAAESRLTSTAADLDTLEETLAGADLASLQQATDDAQAAIERLRTVTMPELEAQLDAARAAVAELQETDVGALEVRLAAAERGLSTLRDADLPALEARLAERDTTILGDLAAARGELDAAASGLADAEARLDAQDAAQAAADERMAELGRQASHGPLPPADAPLGAHWVSPTGALYVRVPCEEVA